MHPTDLTISREKLGRFLCGYLNGPDLYEEKYGPIHLAPAHAHLSIGTVEKEAWLLCMKAALEMAFGFIVLVLLFGALGILIMCMGG